MVSYNSGVTVLSYIWATKKKVVAPKPQTLPKQLKLTTPHQGLTCANHISLTLAPIRATLNPLAVKPPDYSGRSFGRVLAWTLARSISTHSFVRHRIAQGRYLRIFPLAVPDVQLSKHPAPGL